MWGEHPLAAVSLFGSGFVIAAFSFFITVRGGTCYVLVESHVSHQISSSRHTCEVGVTRVASNTIISPHL